jgi:hypothetical protein
MQKNGSAPEAVFDVPRPHPYFDYVALMQSNNVTSGCGNSNYCPDANTTRGQMAVFIVRSVEKSDTFVYPTTPYFSDVPATHPYFKYIQRMRQLNITSGCSATQYCPDSAVTRGQMAVFLMRGKLVMTDLPAGSYPGTQSFTDVATEHPYFPFIQKMKQLGVTTGCAANLYCPDNPTTRGQMAVFLIRSFFTPFILP